ncbi:MAG: 2-C-methyl-D-erythritol 2,4-cyclodiphosphate synthase [Vicinamibacterales bacterium]
MTTALRVSAILAAGGKGLRLGGEVPKQLRPFFGSSMLEMSARALLGSPRVDELVVVLPEEMLDVPAWLAALMAPGDGRVRVAHGGPRRQDSVANGFAATRSDASVIVVHDAARPFVSREVIERTIDAAASHGAAIAALPVHDTVKERVPADGEPFIARTLDRRRIFLAQTPQAFRRDVLAEAIRLGVDVEATDEAALVERAGRPVALVDGEARNRKITTPVDWAEAHRMMDDEPHVLLPGARIGTGYDLHRLVEGRRLVLGGVEIPFEKGLAGHSDADIVCHALTDAILGAAGLGDIGVLFPDTDARWKDADSLALLGRAVARVHAAGYGVVNVDVVVIAERPKLGPHREAIRARLAEVLGIEPAAVFVKGKTNEGVDAVGRGEAMAAHAVALLRSTAGV